MVRIDDPLQRRLLTLTAIQIGMALLVIATIAVGAVLLPSRWRALESETEQLADRVEQLEMRLTERDAAANRDAVASRAQARRDEALAERVRLLAELIGVAGVEAYRGKLNTLLRELETSERPPSAWRPETAVAAGRLHLLADDPAGAALWCHVDAGSPPPADAALCRSEALLALGRIDEAYAVSDLAVAGESADARAFLLRGRIELALDRPGDAHTSLTKALASDRTAVDAAVLLIDEALDKHDLTSAELLLERALSLAPDRDDVQRLHARWLRSVGRYEDCVYVVKEIEGADEDLKVLETLAVCLLEAGFPVEARSALAQLLKHRPDDARTHDWLGRAHAELMEYHRAADAFGRAVALRPELVSAWYHLGVVRLNRNDLDDAQAALLRAVELDDNHAGAQFALAVCLARQGDEARARLALQRSFGVDASLMEQALAIDAFEPILVGTAGAP